MKATILFFLCFLALLSNVRAQDSIIDQIESTLKRVSHNTVFPCTKEMKVTQKGNGLLVFAKNDSLKYEIKFFDTKKLPSYSPEESSFEISKSFLAWEENLTDFKKTFTILKTETNEKDNYVLVKIADSKTQFYRMLLIAEDTTYSVTLYSSKTFSETDLEDLKIVGLLNRSVK